jgi:hypothetical protein
MILLIAHGIARAVRSLPKSRRRVSSYCQSQSAGKLKMTSPSGQSWPWRNFAEFLAEDLSQPKAANHSMDAAAMDSLPHENPKLGAIAMGSVSSKCAAMLNRGHRAKSGQRAQRPSDRTQAGAGAQLIANHDSFFFMLRFPLGIAQPTLMPSQRSVENGR